MLDGTGQGARRGRRSDPVRVAALDLGTNNCRLLIASSARDGELRIVDSFSRIVRLGEGVAQSSELSADAIERTMAALKICSEHIRAKGVSRVRAIATEACRRAHNASILLERARTEAGIELEIVTTQEEARLAALGCTPLIDPNAQGALIFDIGGGSTEMIWMRRASDHAPSIVSSHSEPTGVVSLSEEWGNRPTDQFGYEQMRTQMIERFRPWRDEMNRAGSFDPATHHLLGTSGTVTTLAGVALGLARYNRNRVDGSWHDCAEILTVIDHLVQLDLDGRAAVGCVGPDRADLIVPGCAIFAAVQELWPCSRLRVADRGLREGILRELLAGRIA